MLQPLIQKLPLDGHSSFIAKTFRTPDFEVGWHQHIEYELILFTEGSGMSFVGNSVGEFNTGDIYFLGSNLPHTFQKSGDGIASAIVVQFKEDFCGEGWKTLPECRDLRKLFQHSRFGLRLKPPLTTELAPLMQMLEAATGFRRILLLGECLERIQAQGAYLEVSSLETRPSNSRNKEVIDAIFQHTIDHFRESIGLEDVAVMACMSVPAFCRYFKRSTKKTYIDFLNEIRVGYACSLLADTRKPVHEVCYESGYNTLANFHKHFLRLKGLTPLQYRKAFSGENLQKGNNIGIAAG